MKKNTILLSLLVTSIFSFGFDFSSMAKDVVSGFTKEKNTDSNTGLSLSEVTVSNGLKEALKIGVSYATKELGAKDGYLNNADAKISLPTNLQKIESLVRKAGGDKYVDELIVSMNDAATKAAPKTVDIFIDSITKMDINDAKKILAGDKSSATEYFKSSSYEKLKKVIAPIVKESIESSSVATNYKNFNTYYKKGAANITKNDSVMGYAKTFGVDKYIPNDDEKDLDEYITASAIDGLFKIIAQKESDIRKNSLSQTTSLLKKVFGK